jgi:hypothetical protein
VNPHSHLDLSAVGPLVRGDRALCVGSGSGGVPHPGEDGEERLGLPVDDEAAVGLDRRFEQPAVLGHDLPVLILQPVL